MSGFVSAASITIFTFLPACSAIASDNRLVHAALQGARDKVLAWDFLRHCATAPMAGGWTWPWTSASSGWPS